MEVIGTEMSRNPYRILQVMSAHYMVSPGYQRSLQTYILENCGEQEGGLLRGGPLLSLGRGLPGDYIIWLQTAFYSPMFSSSDFQPFSSP